MAGALSGAAAANPLVPTPGEAALGWTVSVVAGALWVAGFVSLGRSPLDARARLPSSPATPPMSMPNLVPITTSSRRAPRARPSRSSDRPGSAP